MVFKLYVTNMICLCEGWGFTINYIITVIFNWGQFINNFHQFGLKMVPMGLDIDDTIAPVS